MVRADMPAAIQRKLQALFLGYGKGAQERELLRQASGIARFVAADNRILEPVSAFKFATERSQIEQDPALSRESKAQRLSAIESRQRAFAQSLAPSR